MNKKILNASDKISEILLSTEKAKCMVEGLGSDFFDNLYPKTSEGLCELEYDFNSASVKYYILCDYVYKIDEEVIKLEKMLDYIVDEMRKGEHKTTSHER